MIPLTADIAATIPDEVDVYCPHLTDKMLVDYANGLQMARQRITYQKENDGLIARLWGGIIGTSSHRQQLINDHLTGGLEATLGWLADLTKHLARTDVAVASLGQAVETVALKLGQTRDAVVALDQARQAIESRMADLSRDVARLDFKDRADDHLELTVTSWESGRFRGIPVLTQAFVVFDQLYWGDFGHFCRAHPDRAPRFQQLALEKVRKASRMVWGIGAQDKDRVIASKDWLALPQPPASHAPTGQGLLDAVECMGDWTDPTSEPLSWTASAMSHQQALPQRFPRLLTPMQVSDRMCQEVLVRERWRGRPGSSAREDGRC